MSDGPQRSVPSRWRLSAQPINRSLLVSFILVALVPLGFLAVKLYDTAWSNAWREIREKHQLLAQNLAAPLQIYVDDQRNALSLVAAILEVFGSGGKNVDDGLLSRATDNLKGFRSITLVDRDGRIVYSDDPAGRSAGKRMAFAHDKCFLHAVNTGKGMLSGIKLSPLTDKPTLIMSRPVVNREGKVIWVLLGELRMDLIENLRRNIHFGTKGHSAIVDQFGRVIAHPNADWMHTMHDLSGLPVVKDMMAGKTGVTEFYSPFIKAPMVAGYSAVPGVGWGVMVPQPKSEVAAEVSRLLWANFTRGALGLLMALALAFLLARWITRPLNQLAGAAANLTAHGFRGHIPSLHGGVPRELRQLGQAFSTLVDGLQKSREEVDKLNRSLSARVEDATQELRQANQQLERLAQEDHLTGLANRRCFEDGLHQSSQGRRMDDVGLCVILIDVDHFKRVNDGYGHAAGDAVLVQLAGLLRTATRPGDLVARYGGDEFVVKMHCGAEVARQRAQEILSVVENHVFTFEGNALHVTVSIGLLRQDPTAVADPDSLLQRVDRALYEAKGAGRNCLVEVAI